MDAARRIGDPAAGVRDRPSDQAYARAALRRLSAIEVWERFSFYSMFSLLPLFLIAEPSTGGFGWTQGDALRFFGAYVGIAYASPFLGGLATDRWLGSRLALHGGAILMAAGHFLLALPALLSVRFAGRAAPVLYAALGLLAIGNALFKPNISVLVGRLPYADAAARDAAFATFYLYINVGALIAGLVAGWLALHLGWHWAFGAAGVGMLAAIALIRLFGRNYIRPLTSDDADRGAASPAQAVSSRFPVCAFAVVCSTATAFVVCSYQTAGLFSVFAATHIDRHVIGIEIPPSWFVALNPLFIILLAPMLARYWRAGRGFGHDWSAAQKFSAGFLLVAGAFLLLDLAARQAGSAGMASPLWLVACYFTMTLGELLIGPVSTAAASRLSPPHQQNMAMGLLFAAIGMGGWLSGQVGGAAVELGTSAVSLAIAVSALAVSVALWAARSRLGRLGV